MSNRELRRAQQRELLKHRSTGPRGPLEPVPADALASADAAGRPPPPIRRHSPPIWGRARMLRVVCPTIPRGMLAPHGLRLSWQIARDRRPVQFRRARTRTRCR